PDAHAHTAVGHLVQLREVEHLQQQVDRGLAGELATHHATRAGTPTRCTRGVVVDPGAPGGLPATITTASPGPAMASRRSARSTSSNISPVCGTAVTGFTRTPT